MKYIIGVDIGTTHTKAVILSTMGTVAGEMKVGYPSFQPMPGYQEQNPNDVLASVVEVLKKAFQTIPPHSDIAGICFSGAMHSIMAVGENGEPLTSLLTWADIRSNNYAVQLKNSPLGQQLYQQTGTPIHPMSPLCKIAWIKENMPEVFASAHKFISGKEYVLFNLFGQFMVDFSIASATGLFDHHRLEWSEAALAFAGIGSEQLSRPVSPVTLLKGIKEKYSSAIGWPSDLPAIIGAADGGLANLGSGAIFPGEVAVTIGTSGAARIISTQAITDAKQQLFSYLLDEKNYFCGGAVNNGGNVLKWFSDTFGNQKNTEDNIASFLQLAAEAPAGAQGLVFLPYINGERAPVWDANAKGVFFGVSSSHTKAHFIRAVLEGISFSMLQIIQAMEQRGVAIETLYASGGFIESPLWLQMLSDITNKKILVSHAADASALGAAFLGLFALGHIKNWQEVKSFIPSEQAILPNKADQDKYVRNFSVFIHLYDKLKDDFSIVSGL